MTLSLIGQVCSEEVQVHAGGPMGTKQIFGTAAEHPRKAGRRRGNSRCIYLLDGLTQVGEPKFRLTKRVHFVLPRPIGRKKDPGPEEKVLHVRLRGSGTNRVEGEGSDRARIPG